MPGTYKITRWIYSIGFSEQGYKDSNLEMTESESVALPFGDSPLFHNKMNYKVYLKKNQVLFLIFFKKFFQALILKYFRVSNPVLLSVPPSRKAPASSYPAGVLSGQLKSNCFTL